MLQHTLITPSLSAVMGVTYDVRQDKTRWQGGCCLHQIRATYLWWGWNSYILMDKHYFDKILDHAHKLTNKIGHIMKY